VEASKAEIDDALGLFQRSAEQTPDFPTNYYYLGLTWAGKNEPGRARKQEKAIELKPDYAQAHTALDCCFEVRRSNARPGGISASRHADPDLAEAHYNFRLA
jgi:hypothetical protein